MLILTWFVFENLKNSDLYASQMKIQGTTNYVLYYTPDVFLNVSGLLDNSHLTLFFISSLLFHLQLIIVKFLTFLVT